MKRGEWKIEPGIVWFLLIIVLIVIIMIIGSWECKNDSDCQNDEICTVKHTCFKNENIEKTIIKTEYKYITASIILGICIILAAIILRIEDFKLSHHIHRIKNSNFRKK